MRNNTTRKFACLALCAMAAIVSRSDTFPNAGGDIADTSPDGWDGAVPSVVTLDKTGTYTVGSDISLTQMILGGGDVTFDLTDPSSGKVSIAGEGTYRNGFYISDAGNNTANCIKGGVWDFSKTGSFGVAKYWTTGGNATNASLTVSDGAVITNCYGVKVAFCKGPCDNQLILTGDGTTLHLANDSVRVSQYNGNPAGMKASLKILDGARLLFPSLYTDASGSSATSVSRVDSSVVVSGVGSLLSGSSLRLGGQYRAGATASVGNGAALQLTSYMYIGENAYSSECGVFVTNNATARAAGVYVANAANSHSNCLTVADGGTLTCSDFIYLGHSGASENSVIISNANVTCKTFRFMPSETNTLHVCGTSATLTCESFYFGSAGATTNATVVLGGKSPAIIVNENLYYGDTASTGTVTFRVPAGGYTSTPISVTKDANFRAGIALDVDLSECLARGKRSAFQSTLVQAGTLLTLNAAQLAAAQASVAAQLEAADCKGSLEKVGNSLVLTVKPREGFVIIFK